MLENVISVISEFSYESLIIAFLVFILTMIIKYPIKKATNKMNETKRKAINSIFILIPLIMSFLISILYYRFIQSIWISITNIKVVFSSWLLSLSIYNIYERIKLIIINIFSGKQDLDYIEKNNNEIKNLLNKLHKDQQKLNQIEKHILDLTNKQDNVSCKQKNIDIQTIFNSNIEIANLTNEKKQLKNEINNIKNEIETKST